MRGVKALAWLVALLLILAPFPASAEPLTADLVVWGGTPEGIAAAIGASRAGARVILAVRGSRLGGVLVESELNTLDQSLDPKGRPYNEGLFTEWFRRIEAESFNPETAERAFRQLLAEEMEAAGGRRGGSLQVLYNVSPGEPILKEGRLVALPFRRSFFTSSLIAARWIDASEDGDLAASAGVPFTIGWESLGLGQRGQAAGLIFRLRHVDWKRARAHAEADESPGTGSTRHSIWGFPEAAAYKPDNPNLRLRALNVGLVKEDEVLINGLLLFGVDPLDPASRRRAKAEAEAELPRILAYLREVCPGFERAKLAGTASALYIRESRHLADPLHQLTLQDVNENRSQPDVIAWGSYPVDVHPRFPGEPVRVLGTPKGFAVPLRSLLTASLSNLAISSRSAGYTPEAHGSTRTVPLGMATGQAAGVAAALSVQKGITLHELAATPALVLELQRRLVAQGVRLR